MRLLHTLSLLTIALPIGTALGAQQNAGRADSAAAERPAPAVSAPSSLLVPAIEIQNLRPVDQRGTNVFEGVKSTTIPFTGFKLSLGAAFTQQFQSLTHENSASPRVVAGVNQNQLMSIGNGFNNAVANLYLNAQLAPGIRVAMTSYLSSRHHQETWVKDGYLMIDDSPIDHPALKKLMEVVSLKAGHFEINYGDAHFRRTDNGHSFFNPFVGNYILDAFTTEIGAEVYLRKNGLLGMVGLTAGEVKGSIQDPANRTPTVLGKVGFDRQLNSDLRVRLTGSGYMNARSPSNTLFAGDRAGSRYYLVLENSAATTNANFSSGLFNPGFGREVTSFQINPFVKFRGLEVFGVLEQAKGRNAAEYTADGAKRSVQQIAGDALYRFGGDKFYAGGRWNTVSGRLAGMPADVTMQRSEIGGGWFVTPLVLLKVEYVNQKYTDFPTTDIRNGGRFKGFMIEGGVAF